MKVFSNNFNVEMLLFKLPCLFNDIPINKNLCGYLTCHKPSDPFSHFHVYWKQTRKPNLYRDTCNMLVYEATN